MTDALQVRGLRKSYGKKEALKGVDLCVRKGDIFALLGVNGLIAFTGTVAELTEKVGTHYNVRVKGNRETKEFEVDNIGPGLIAILRDYQKRNIVIQDIQVDRGSLEQHFVKIAKEGD